jgi:hypothetical protein
MIFLKRMYVASHFHLANRHLQMLMMIERYNDGEYKMD